MSSSDPALHIWREIAADLEAAKRRLYDEIRRYPTPIAGCDQQFNYLLERQTRLVNELTWARERLAEPASTTAENAPSAAEFIRSSQGLDAAAKQKLLALAASA